MVFSSEQLMWAWTGNSDLAKNAGTYLPFIAFSYAMLALALVPYTIAIANGYTFLNNILGLFSLFVTLPGYWLATKEYGAIGAAIVYCAVQTIITLIYLYFVNKKFVINNVNAHELYLKKIAFPLGLALCVAYGFSLIPEWSDHSRILALAQIGFATCCTLIITTFVLVPIKDIRTIFKTKSSNE